MLITRDILGTERYEFPLVPSWLRLDQGCTKRAIRSGGKWGGKLNASVNEHKQTHAGWFCRTVASWEKIMWMGQFPICPVFALRAGLSCTAWQLKLIENPIVLLEEAVGQIWDNYCHCKVRGLILEGERQWGRATKFSVKTAQISGWPLSHAQKPPWR